MKKRLYKSTTDKKISGVCAGVAEYFDIDVSIVRIAWAAVSFFWGFGIILYIIMAFVLPDAPADNRRVIDVEAEVVTEKKAEKEKYKGPEID